MDVIVGKRTKNPITYRIDFHHNVGDKISGVTIYKDGKFVSNGNSVCAVDDDYCKDCCRKHSLENAFAVSGKGVIPREHRYEIWETYRKLPKTMSGKVNPRWVKSPLKRKSALLATA